MENSDAHGDHTDRSVKVRAGKAGAKANAIMRKPIKFLGVAFSASDRGYTS